VGEKVPVVSQDANEVSFPSDGQVRGTTLGCAVPVASGVEMWRPRHQPAARGFLVLCLCAAAACGENADSEEFEELEARVAELESELRAASSSPSTTTTSMATTTRSPTTTSSTASKVDDAEVVESIRRVAAAASRSLGGMALSTDILTDRQIVEDVKALCVDVQGDREGLAERYEAIPAGVRGAAELALLKVKITWAVGYCPGQRAALVQVAADIDDALEDVTG
jgi:hypothetical protein